MYGWRLDARGISTELLVEIIETGKKIGKERENRFWIFKEVPTRSDNFLCISIAIERSNLVVVTALINWRPTNED